MSKDHQQGPLEDRTVMCCEVTRGCPFSTMIMGRQMRPPSLAMCTVRWWWFMYTLTNSLKRPARRSRRKLETNRVGYRVSPMMLPLTLTTNVPGL